MLEDFVEEAIVGNKDLKDRVVEKISEIISSEQFFKALEENMLNTIRNMDFDDILYDLMEQEDVFKPLVSNLKRKIQENLE